MSRAATLAAWSPPSSKADTGDSRRLLGHNSTLQRLPQLRHPQRHHGELSFAPLFDERLQRFLAWPVVLLGRRRDQVTAPRPFVLKDESTQALQPIVGLRR